MIHLQVGKSNQQYYTSLQVKQRATVIIKSLYSQYQSYAPFVTVLSVKTGESDYMINGGILKQVCVA